MIGVIVSILGSKIGRIAALLGGGALAILIAYGAGNLHGRVGANANCDAAALRAELALVKLQLSAARRAAQNDADRAKLDQERIIELESKTDEFQSKVGTRECFTSDDVDRLRDAWRASPRRR